MKNPKFKLIQNKLKDVLVFLSKWEKLSPNEGLIKVVYGENEKGIEIYAPHLIPQALSYSWLAPTFEEAFEQCLNDITMWCEFEKEAPRSKFWLDME